MNSVKKQYRSYDLWELNPRPVFLDGLDYGTFTFFEALYDKEKFNYITYNMPVTDGLSLLIRLKLIRVLGPDELMNGLYGFEQKRVVVQVGFHGMWFMWNVSRFVEKLNRGEINTWKQFRRWN